MTREINKIHGKFQSLMRLGLKLDKTPKRFGTGHDLSHSEIHLVEIIGDNQGLSVTDVARLLGITKGAVSQSLKRLENKGLTRKRPDPANLSRSLVSLTDLGQTAYRAHRQWHDTMDGGFRKYLTTLSPEDTRAILDFLTRVEDFLVRRIASPE